MGVSVRKPLTTEDLFGKGVGVIKGDFKDAPASERIVFNPKNYKNIKNASPFDNQASLDASNLTPQGLDEKFKNAGVQFGANFVSSIGQALANTFDLSANLRNAKAEFTGGDTDFNANLFGLSTAEMQAWADNIAKHHEIKQESGDEFDLTDSGWWAKQIASAGTGLGMGVEALATTAAIEFATGGLGTGTALLKLGNLVKNLGKTARGVETVAEIMNIAKGMRSAATVYGIVNRLGESAMEGANTYKQVYDELSQVKENGAEKYTEEEKVHLASIAAKKDYNYNLALLPLDILSFRLMTFNPISGKGEGFLEKGLEKLARVWGEGKLGKAAGWVTTHAIGTQIEGFEEGFQYVGQEEGVHKARVEAGLEEESTFGSRLKKDVTSDEFWNNYAGGVIGAPIIAGGMNIINKTFYGRQQAVLEKTYKTEISKIGKALQEDTDEINRLEKLGLHNRALSYRRAAVGRDFINSIHLDAQLDRNSAFTARMEFLKGALNDLNKGETTTLKDVGFMNVKPEDVPKIKEELERYIKTGEKTKAIYDSIKNNYARDLVPTIANHRFMLDYYEEQMGTVNTNLGASTTKLNEVNASLSPQGREIQQIAYKRASVVQEIYRLTELHRTTKVEQERTNIDAILQANVAEKDRLDSRLKEISTDETYEGNAKSTDHDILKVALRDDNHAANVYNKESLGNLISLTRKNLALWDDPKYYINKVQSSIKNMQEEADLIKLKAELAAKDVLDAKTAQAIKDRVAEVQTENVVVTPATDANGETLFGDDIANLTTVTDAIGAVNIPQEETFKNPDGSKSVNAANTQHFYMSPTVYDFSKTSDEAKAKVATGILGLLTKLGPDASFEDLVRHIIKIKKVDMDALWQPLIYGWEANGKGVVDYDAVYDKIFADPLDNVLSGAAQFAVADNPIVVSTNNKEIKEDSEARETGEVIVTDNNQIQYQYQYPDNAVTHESSATMAHISLNTTMHQVVGENGVITVSYEQKTDELGEGLNKDFVDSNILLDLHAVDKGTELELRVPENFEDVYINIYDALGKVSETLKFGEWAAKNPQFGKNSPEYQSKVPIVIYLKSTPKDGKGVAFVRDLSWYHPARFDQSRPDDMKLAIANTKAIREEVISSETNSVASTVTEKRVTTWATTKMHEDGNYDQVPLRQANPEAKIVMVLGDLETLRDSKTNIVHTLSDGSLNNKKLFYNRGDVLEVRPLTMRNGKIIHIASYVLVHNIDNIAMDSVREAMDIYAMSLITNKPVVETDAQEIKDLKRKHSLIHKEILEKMGHDIKSRDGLKAYLSHFIRVFDNKNGADDATIEKRAKDTLPEGTPFIGFLNGGKLVFGQAGKTQYVDNNKLQKMKVEDKYYHPTTHNEITQAEAIDLASTKSFFINPHIGKAINQAGQKLLNSPNFLPMYKDNVDIDALADNKPVVTINKDKTTSTIPSYNDYLLDRLTSSILSYNIGTKEKPNWVTGIQPVVLYDTKKRLAKQTNNATKEEVLEEAKPTPIEVTPIDTTIADEEAKKADIQRIIDEEIANATANLNKILGKGHEQKGYNYSPIVANENEEYYNQIGDLDEKQTKTIKDNTQRIEGLTDNEQSNLVDFIFNQIVSNIPVGTNSIPQADIYKQIKETYDNIVEPLRIATEAEVKRLEGVIAKYNIQDGRLNEHVNGYNYVLGKIEVVAKNLDNLLKSTTTKVELYTSIKEDDTQDIVEIGEDGQVVVDFSTDVLTENPEKGITGAIRRFMGQIQKRDKNGELVVGFLGLPVYENSDVVVQETMKLLNNVRPDFDTMLTTLETFKQSKPWLLDSIDKESNMLSPGLITRLKALDNQNKQLFVTKMTSASLRMSYSLIAFDKFTKTWTGKVKDSAAFGIAETLKRHWRNNLMGDSDFDLIIANEADQLILNKIKAKALIDKFDSWTGKSFTPLDLDMNPYWDKYVKNVTQNGGVIIKPTETALLAELRSKAVKIGDSVKFTGKGGRQFQITNKGDGEYIIAFLGASKPKNIEVEKWLKEFGIVLSPETLTSLMTKGLYHNRETVKPDGLYNTGGVGAVGEKEGSTNGLLGILYNKLKTLSLQDTYNFTEYGDSPLDNSVITSLANLEAKYTSEVSLFGFRVKGKTYFALTAPKFITDTARDLKDKDSVLRANLKNTSFSKHSLWLLLLEDEVFRQRFNITNDGAETVRVQGKKASNSTKAGIADVSDLDHEVSKLVKFTDTHQGEIRYGVKGLAVYPDTSISMRMGKMFMPTMSDKHIAMLVTTAVLNLQQGNISNEKGEVTDDVLKILYEQTVKPELVRMLSYYKRNKGSNIENYDTGAGLFMMMPDMNNVKYGNSDATLVSMIKSRANDLTLQAIEGDADIKKDIYSRLQEYIKALTKEKLEAWKNIGIIQDNEDYKADVENNSNIDPHILMYLDKSYMSKFNGTNLQKAELAAKDFVINSLVANANSFMVVAGDPALSYKSKLEQEEGNTVGRVMDSFINIGKRLAYLIAPGNALANSEKEDYIQLIVDDRKSHAENLSYLEKLYGADSKIVQSYKKVEASDGQEYTTWKEHLDMLAKLGRTSETLEDVSVNEIQEAREMFSNKKLSMDNLSDRQKAILDKVLQPIKPVYTGQLYDEENDVMKVVYIKSSSFPLIPQITAGMEIDKLRLKMEAIQDKPENKGKNVRLAYKTAVKLGAPVSKVNLWNEDGTINQQELDKLDTPHGTPNSNQLLLKRKNFRIQQEVPFKSASRKEDKVSLGTQLMKILFGDGIISHEKYMYNGEEKSGKQLHEIYNNLFIDLVKNLRSQLFSDLGLDDLGKPIDAAESVNKLQILLKKEADKRGYPLQDIEGLKMVEGEFNLPLWAASNSNRYESLLNSIITNKIIKIKMPGNGYVVGSEEGFIVKKKEEGDLTVEDKSKIVYTSSWNGKKLQGVKREDGTLQLAQIFVGSKFRDNDGNLIDLLSKDENDKYIFVTETPEGFKLDESKFDEDLLNLLTFRTPTSGHQSATSVVIAGFLPHLSADLMIVPKGFTKQKGLDFDVDKESGYQFWHHLTKDNKFEVLNDSHIAGILAKINMEKVNNTKLKALIDKYKEEYETAGPNARIKLENDIRTEVNTQKLLNQIDIFDYDVKDIIEKDSPKVVAKLKEKLLQNEIIKVYHSVMAVDDDAIQAKFSKTLNTDFLESEATFIDNLNNESKDNTYWTGLSDEYQKKKLISGSGGKVGTGAYSLDVVFHSLAQQAKHLGNPITLNIETIESDGENKRKVVNPNKFKFGDIYTEDGQLGRVKTLGNEDRSISEVVSERQNMSVDNEKLQIMGRVGINSVTMDVDKVFTLLGFDKGEDGHSISLLFLSQPIIKKYVERIINSKSIVSEYVKDRELKIIADLLKEYDPNTKEEDINENYWDNMSSKMNNANLIANITSKEKDGRLQGAILRRFLEMKAYGIAIKTAQGAINTDSKGLGKSIFDTIEKRNTLNKLGTVLSINSKNMPTPVQGHVSNLDKLLGDYKNINDNLDSVEELKKQGYIDIGKFLVKPTTLSGAFSIYGISTAYNTWNQYFPYDSKQTLATFNEILSITADEDIAENKAVESKQFIFQEMRRYWSASRMIGIFNSSKTANGERARLYIDTDTNTSLAKYLKELRLTQDNPVVDEFIKKNILLNSFELDVNKEGKPSKIKYFNTAGEKYNEDALYKALSSLLTARDKNGNRIRLPKSKIGDKQYTLDSLAQDIIAYCYLGNSLQEAIQFTKYVPISYLDVVGYTAAMRSVNMGLEDNPNLLGVRSGDNLISYSVSEFTMQYIQHNPDKVKATLDSKDLNKLTIDTTYRDGPKSLANLMSFKLKNKIVGKQPPFYRIYNSKGGDKKNQLYWLDFDGETYIRLDILGVFGMDEYQPTGGVGGLAKSIVNDSVKAIPTSLPNVMGTVSTEKEIETEKDIFDITSNDVSTVLGNIANKQLGAVSLLAKALAPYTANKKILFKNEIVDSETGKLLSNFDGIYMKGTDEIYINPESTKNFTPDELAIKILHEVIHSLTTNQISKYITIGANGETQVALNAPLHVSNMVRLYNNVKNLSKVSDKAIEAINTKINKGDAISVEEYYTIYPFKDIYEFMSMAITENRFQQYLNKKEFNQTGRTLLDEFKEIIKSILSQIGVTFDSNSAAAQAINSIFTIIDRENPTLTNVSPQNQQMFIEVMNIDDSDLVDFNKLMDSKSNFLGYKGGFENTGKGTPQGDGKDKAMRAVADNFIGEVKSLEGKTSTNTSYNQLDVNERGENLDIKGGFSVASYESSPKVVMLARNKEFSGVPLSDRTKESIETKFNRGAEFVVGDMPNVDSQFIDYLQEIGAKFTIYHTGNTSRIDIGGSNRLMQLSPKTFPNKVLDIKEEKCI